MKKGDIFYKKHGPVIYKCHTVIVLEKEDKPQIVYKYYGKYKQWWHYEIISLWFFENLKRTYALTKKELEK